MNFTNDNYLEFAHRVCDASGVGYIEYMPVSPYAIKKKIIDRKETSSSLWVATWDFDCCSKYHPRAFSPGRRLALLDNGPRHWQHNQ